MHEYDVAFKLTLQQVDVALRELTGTVIKRWLNVELPEIRNTRLDLLGETEDGDLVHVELQSTNDPNMALRMAEYCLAVFRLLKRFPHQVLIYAGEAPIDMEAELHAPALHYSYRLVDIRELDGRRLLESPSVGDNILAILAGVPEIRSAVHQVIERIALLAPGERETAMTRLFILAGLRKVGYIVEEEAKKMPILNDILDHDVIGREYKRGREEGVQHGEITVLHRLIEKRFGSVPSWVENRLTSMSPAQLEDLSVRILDANSIEELLS